MAVPAARGGWLWLLYPFSLVGGSDMGASFMLGSCSWDGWPDEIKTPISSLPSGKKCFFLNSGFFRPFFGCFDYTAYIILGVVFRMLFPLKRPLICRLFRAGRPSAIIRAISLFIVDAVYT